MPAERPIVWTEGAEPGELIARHGGSIFHYYPDDHRMEWRGHVYRGVAPADVDGFVRNREDH